MRRYLNFSTVEVQIVSFLAVKRYDSSSDGETIIQFSVRNNKTKTVQRGGEDETWLTKMTRTQNGFGGAVNISHASPDNAGLYSCHTEPEVNDFTQVYGVRETQETAAEVEMASIQVNPTCYMWNGVSSPDHRLLIQVKQRVVVEVVVCILSAVVVLTSNYLYAPRKLTSKL